MPISVLGSSAQNTAGFVDVSWLRAQGARRLKREAKDTGINAEEVCFWLASIHWMKHEYLRTYFYEAQYEDGHAHRIEQRKYLDRIADTTGAHLRLGHLIHRNERLQQKGVDSLIVLDLLLLAQQGAYDSAILIAGDRDFAEAVRAVQGMGKRIALAGPENAGIAKEMRQLADEIFEIPTALLARMLKGDPPPYCSPVTCWSDGLPRHSA